MKVLVKDIGVFEKYLQSIARIVNSAELNISKDLCKIYGINDSATIRLFIETNCVSSDEPVKFCMNDLQKLTRLNWYY